MATTHSSVRVGILLLTLVAGRAGATQTQGAATVYRDENDLPHIVADTEEAAWYALGHEEARDALHHIRFNLAIWTGRAASLIKDTPQNLFNDFIIKLADADKSGASEEDLRALLRIEGLPNPEQLYENLEAYVEGINDYIDVYRAVEPSSANPVRQWIEDNHDWIVDTHVTVGQVASYGAAEKARQTAARSFKHFQTPCTAIPLSATAANAAPDPIWLMDLKSVLPDGVLGSNAFQWTHGYTDDQGSLLAGSVADPHLGRNRYALGSGATHSVIDHLWFAHIKVEDEGVVKMNTLGWLLHGSGVFGAGHNENVATAGSLGDPNIADVFLLRTRVNPSTSAWEYYSYHADEDGDNGEDDDDWIAFESRTITVQLPDTCITPDLDIDIWTTKPIGTGGGSFGYVYELTATTLELEPGAHPCAASTTVPYVLAHRLPVDPSVDALADDYEPENHHARLAVANYQAMRSASVADIIASASAHDSGLMLAHQSLDRSGSIFGLQLGTIPQRGNDQALQSTPWSGLYNSVTKSTQLQAPSVTAAFSCDKAWEWVLDEDGGPEYLEFPPFCESNSASPDFWPYILYTHAGAAQPPRETATEYFENPGFVALNNDFTYHAWRKRAEWEPPAEGEFECSASTISWVGHVAPENELLDQMFESGTLYHQSSTSREANQRNQLVIDTLTPIYQEMIGGSGSSPLSLANSKKLAMENRWYAAEDYPTAEIDHLPVPVRHLEELRLDYIAESPTSLRARAIKEAKFFSDLWGALFNPPPGSTWASVTTSAGTFSLKQIWVDGVSDPFYYSETGVQFLEMPEEAALIDFHPKGTFGWVNGTYEPFNSTELGQLNTLMALLRNWDPNEVEDYSNHPSSRAAALLSIYQLGMDKGSRPWTGLVNGKLPVGPHELATSSTAELALVGPNGELPVPGPGSVALLYLEPFAKPSEHSFREKALSPINTLGSVLLDDWGAEETNTAKGRYFDVPIPYSALYNGTAVKSTLTQSDINKFVFFFLELGGFHDPNAATINPAAKKEAWEENEQSLPPNTALAVARANAYRVGYPYTRALGEVRLLDRVLETYQYLIARPGFAPLGPTFGDIYRVQVKDITGNVAWPQGGSGWLGTTRPCVGGFLRSVAVYQVSGPRLDGFADQMLCLGGSGNPLVAFFPYNEPESPPRSFYWNVPGQKVMDGAFQLQSFLNHIDAFRNNNLLDTKFPDEEFMDNPVSTVTHYY